MNYCVKEKEGINLLSAEETIYTTTGWTGEVGFVYGVNVNKYSKQPKIFIDMNELLRRINVYIKVNDTYREVYIGEDKDYFSRGVGKIKKYQRSIVATDSLNCLTRGGSKYLEYLLYTHFDRGCGYTLLNSQEPEFSDNEDFGYLNSYFKHLLHIIKTKTPYGKLFKYPEEGFVKILKDDQSVLENFIYQCATDTYPPYGRMKRSNGYYCLPSQGDMSSTIKQSQLTRIVTCMIENLDSRHLFIFDESSAKKIVDKCNLPIVEEDLKNGYRTLLVAQHINYLQKLGMIEKADGHTWNAIRIRPIAYEFATDANDNLNEYFILALEINTWFGIRMRDFVRKLIKIVDHINFDEWLYIVSHSGISDYDDGHDDYSTPERMADLIFRWRRVSLDIREELKMYHKKEYTKLATATTSYSNHKSDAKESYDYVFNNGLHEDHSKLLEKYKDYLSRNEFFNDDQELLEI